MKVVFFGLGSIGRRHLSLLQSASFLKTPVEIFAARSTAGGKPAPAGVKEVAGWDGLDRIHPNVAFICNPTSLHIDTALKCAKRGMHLFLEKPIGHSEEGLAELLEVVRKENLTAYVAYPLRFHAGVERLRERLSGRNATGQVRTVVSSYLPSWRPGTDHLKSYSARKDLGGGVILDLSHEFDLMEHLFGPVSAIQGTAGRQSDVTVDCEDHASAVFNAGEYHVSLEMSFCSKESRRTVEVALPDEDMKLDLVAQELSVKTAAGASTEKFEQSRDEMFSRQLRYFFENLSNPRLMNNLEDASRLFKRILAFRNEAFP